MRYFTQQFTSEQLMVEWLNDRKGVTLVSHAVSSQKVYHDPFIPPQNRVVVSAIMSVENE